jgi:hypothetical protein
MTVALDRDAVAIQLGLAIVPVVAEFRIGGGIGGVAGRRHARESEQEWEAVNRSHSASLHVVHVGLGLPAGMDEP